MIEGGVMIEWLQQVEFWHWWILGVGLVIIEIVAPGAFFLWLGVSAGATGLVLLIFPCSNGKDSS